MCDFSETVKQAPNDGQDNPQNANCHDSCVFDNVKQAETRATSETSSEQDHDQAALVEGIMQVPNGFESARSGLIDVTTDNFITALANRPEPISRSCGLRR
jgi:hypothetical protein